MTTQSRRERLRELGIRHFDLLIHDQRASWIIEHFKKGADEYPINVSLLMRNIIWQLRERVINKQREPLHELVRTFWYMHIKPTLSRVNALSPKTDQYIQLVDTLVSLVKDHNLMQYKDIGFRDNNEAARKVGLNPNIILFSEKLGHAPFLNDIRDKYQISTLALGGQPSVMNVEYFVDDLKANKVDIRRSFFLFSIVDYDTSGWIVRDAFINNLKHYGIKNIKNQDLIHPDMLKPEEIKIARFQIPDSRGIDKKNTLWLRQIKKKNYKNQKYLGPLKDQNNNRLLYGLEAESVSAKRLEQKLDKLLEPLVGKTEDILKLVRFEALNKALGELTLLKLR